MRLRIGFAALPFCLYLLLGAGLTAGPVQQARAADATRSKNEGVHGQPWAFGVSQSREEALWQSSVNAHDMQDRATPDRKSKAHDISPSADQSPQKRSRGKRDSIGMSWDRQKGRWRSSAAPNTPDEHLPVESEHHVRAYADVPAGDGLDIKMGPEVIVKDGKETPYTGKRNEDPKSSVGMGMQFKLDF